jgi:hypothetical protein
VIRPCRPSHRLVRGGHIHLLCPSCRRRRGTDSESQRIKSRNPDCRLVWANKVLSCGAEGSTELTGRDQHRYVDVCISERRIADGVVSS